MRRMQLRRPAMRFRCWVPDEGYTREDAKDVEAYDAGEAAEEPKVGT